MKYTELISLLKQAVSFDEINCKRDQIAELIPAVRLMFDFDQKNHAHQYDLWEHCVQTVLNLPKTIDNDLLFLAALLHDIGKPDSQCCGRRADDKNMHYYGHPRRSVEIVCDQILPSLNQSGVQFTGDELRRLLYYVEYHDDRVSLRIKHLKRHLCRATFEDFQNLMHLQIADAKAHVLLPVIQERIRICEQWSGEFGREKYEMLKRDSKEMFVEPGSRFGIL